MSPDVLPRVSGKTCRGLAYAALAAGLLSGCAAPKSYMGVSLAPGSADPLMQDIARSARAGDKQAQLQLGIAYEEGRGVAPDLVQARKLYALAAAESGGTIWVYQPATRKGGAGRTVPVNMGPKRTGLQEAGERLLRLSKLEAGPPPTRPDVEGVGRQAATEVAQTASRPDTSEEERYLPLAARVKCATIETYAFWKRQAEYVVKAEFIHLTEYTIEGQWRYGKDSEPEHIEGRGILVVKKFLKWPRYAEKIDAIQIDYKYFVDDYYCPWYPKPNKTTYIIDFYDNKFHVVNSY